MHTHIYTCMRACIHTLIIYMHACMHALIIYMHDTARARHTQTHLPRRDAYLKYEQDSLTPRCQLLRQRLFLRMVTRCCLSVASGGGNGLLYFLADRQASDYFMALGYEPQKKEFCHRRGVYFHQHRCTIDMACAQAVAIRGPHVARRHASVPRALQLRVALDDWVRKTFTSVSELKLCMCMCVYVCSSIVEPSCFRVLGVIGRGGGRGFSRWWRRAGGRWGGRWGREWRG